MERITGILLSTVALSCTYLKNRDPTAKSGYYDIDPLMAKEIWHHSQCTVT